jgi:hypothetical protein
MCKHKGPLCLCRGYDEQAVKEQAVAAIPEAMRDRLNAIYPLTKLPPGVATDYIGMGTWRLKGMEEFDFIGPIPIRFV